MFFSFSRTAKEPFYCEQAHINGYLEHENDGQKLFRFISWSHAVCSLGVDHGAVFNSFPTACVHEGIALSYKSAGL